MTAPLRTRDCSLTGGPPPAPGSWGRDRPRLMVRHRPTMKTRPAATPITQNAQVSVGRTWTCTVTVRPITNPDGVRIRAVTGTMPPATAWTCTLIVVRRWASTLIGAGCLTTTSRPLPGWISTRMLLHVLRQVVGHGQGQVAVAGQEVEVAQGQDVHLGPDGVELRRAGPGSGRRRRRRDPEGCSRPGAGRRPGSGPGRSRPRSPRPSWAAWPRRSRTASSWLAGSWVRRTTVGIGAAVRSVTASWPWPARSWLSVAGLIHGAAADGGEELPATTAGLGLKLRDAATSRIRDRPGRSPTVASVSARKRCTVRTAALALLVRLSKRGEHVVVQDGVARRGQRGQTHWAWSWAAVGGWDDAASTSVVLAGARGGGDGRVVGPAAGRPGHVGDRRARRSVVARIEVLPEPAAATAALSRLSSWLSAIAIRSGSP